jgi:NAD(P)-dependent dehydrogenase (short-subunit alcohol dehydrogenase family)
VPEEAERLVGQALREAGRLDLVVHAAARDLRGAVDVQPVDDWWSVVETQLTGAFHVLHAAIPHLESSGGAIVLVACEWGVVGRAGASAVSAAASGLMGLTKALAREYGPRVRTNCVAPGELAGTSVDQAAYPGVPVDRIARPDADSVAAAVTFLAGPDGRAFNGQVLHPNGGATLA